MDLSHCWTLVIIIDFIMTQIYWRILNLLIPVSIESLNGPEVFSDNTL